MSGPPERIEQRREQRLRDGSLVVNIQGDGVGLLAIDPHGDAGTWPSMLTGIGQQVGNELPQPICIPSATLIADHATMDLTVGVHELELCDRLIANVRE